MNQYERRRYCPRMASHDETAFNRVSHILQLGKRAASSIESPSRGAPRKTYKANNGTSVLPCRVAHPLTPLPESETPLYSCSDGRKRNGHFASPPSWTTWNTAEVPPGTCVELSKTISRTHQTRKGMGSFAVAVTCPRVNSLAHSLQAPF